MANRWREALEPAAVWWFVTRPRVRYVIAWVVALSTAAVYLHEAWRRYEHAERRDGNEGHCQIDFGGQWLMGRMAVEGRARHLYDRNVQREVLRAHFPRANQPPDKEKSDAESLMGWVMGKDDPEAARAAGALLAPLAADSGPAAAALLAAGDHAWTPELLDRVTAKQVGGPLYPPVNLFFAYPYGLFPPIAGYRVGQVANLILAFVAGYGLSLLARGRVWWPVASFGVLIFPGFSGTINLAQNATLTLTILTWGWVLLARGRPGWGGVVWGLLAFKPVWAAAFLLVPLWGRRWRFLAAMIGTGAALSAATLPFVGPQAWLDWLAIGREAAALYNVDENWIFLSRDLLGVPRRWLLDFTMPTFERDTVGRAPALIGWGMVLAVVVVTTGFAVWRRREARATEGPAAAFLLIGAWLSCFHFMYYDVLLAALPVFLLFTEPSRYLEPILVVIAWRPRLGAAARDYYRPALSHAPPAPLPPLALFHGGVWVVNRMLPTLAVFLWATQRSEGWPRFGLRGDWTPPWETFFLAVIWLWCGGLWAVHAARASSASPRPPEDEGEGLWLAVSRSASPPGPSPPRTGERGEKRQRSRGRKRGTFP